LAQCLSLMEQGLGAAMKKKDKQQLQQQIEET
jgi:hypothetical protein